jgi:hypothetical protein
MTAIVIVSAVRTAVGSFGGSLTGSAATRFTGGSGSYQACRYPARGY